MGEVAKGDGEGLEEEASSEQSFLVAELCLPPKVPHLLQLASLMGTHTSLLSLPPSLPPSLPHYDTGEGVCATALVWKSEGSFQDSALFSPWS